MLKAKNFLSTTGLQILVDDCVYMDDSVSLLIVVGTLFLFVFVVFLVCLCM